MSFIVEHKLEYDFYKEYINVKVDFNSQPSELVLISEQGYIYFKRVIVFETIFSVPFNVYI